MVLLKPDSGFYTIAQMIGRRCPSGSICLYEGKHRGSQKENGWLPTVRAAGIGTGTLGMVSLLKSSRMVISRVEARAPWCSAGRGVQAIPREVPTSCFLGKASLSGQFCKVGLLSVGFQAFTGAISPSPGNGQSRVTQNALLSLLVFFLDGASEAPTNFPWKTRRNHPRLVRAGSRCSCCFRRGEMRAWTYTANMVDAGWMGGGRGW